MVVDVLPPPSAVSLDCVRTISSRTSIPVLVLLTLMRTEGGRPGLAVKNTNGTRDYGVMQINSVWIPRLERTMGVTLDEIRDNGCLNVAAGALILRHLWIKEKNLYGAIGHYHSNNVRLSNQYRRLFLNNMDDIALELEKTASR